ncbi:MAG: ABC transporter substrate-binding protein [Actinomycetota bacterium]
MTTPDRTGKPTIGRWLAGLLALALLAAACGGDEDSAADGDGADAPAPTATPEPAAEPESEPEAESGQDNPDDEGGTTEAEPEAELTLTASDRGVTAEAITIGHTAIDFVTLNETFGLDLAFQSFIPSLDAAVAFYNERGGVLGRQIEVVHEEYLPVGGATAEAACLALTEDNEIFAVIGGFQGPGAEAINECIVNLHDTILVGGAPTAEQIAATGSRWISQEMSLDRRNAAFVNLLANSGTLAELGPLMVIGANPSEQFVVDEMTEALRAAGADVVLSTVTTTSGDAQATRAEVDVMIERAETDGAETIVLLGEGEIRNIAFFEAAPDFTYLVPNGDRVTDWQAIPPEGLEDGTRVLSSLADVRPGVDPALDECLDAVADALGVEIKHASELEEGEPNYYSGTENSCVRISMFIQIAEAAGPDLTTESWVAALDTVPELHIPGYQFFSLSSAKPDANDQLKLVEYDLPTLTFVDLTDYVDVG